MNKINLLLMLLVSIFLASCQKDNEPVIVYDIPDEFNIEIFQELDNSGEFFLKLSTVDEYPDNYRIEADIKTIDNKLELNIYRILSSPNPSNQNVTISKKIKIDPTALGNYPLDLIIRNTVVNEGAISITPTTVKLDFSTKQGITAKHYEVNRIPPNGYWGIAYVDISSHVIYLDQFIQKIKAVSTEFTPQKTGNYGYFTINDQNEVILPTPQDEFKTFYMMSDEFDAIKSYIQEYKAIGIGFHALIYTAQGEVFYQVSYDPPSPSAKQAPNNKE